MCKRIVIACLPILVEGQLQIICAKLFSNQTSTFEQEGLTMHLVAMDFNELKTVVW